MDTYTCTVTELPTVKDFMTKCNGVYIIILLYSIKMLMTSSGQGCLVANLVPLVRAVPPVSSIFLINLSRSLADQGFFSEIHAYCPILPYFYLVCNV